MEIKLVNFYNWKIFPFLILKLWNTTATRHTEFQKTIDTFEILWYNSMIMNFNFFLETHSPIWDWDHFYFFEISIFYQLRFPYSPNDFRAGKFWKKNFCRRNPYSHIGKLVFANSLYIMSRHLWSCDQILGASHNGLGLYFKFLMDWLGVAIGTWNINIIYFYIAYLLKISWSYIKLGLLTARRELSESEYSKTKQATSCCWLFWFALATPKVNLTRKKWKIFPFF